MRVKLYYTSKNFFIMSQMPTILRFYYTILAATCLEDTKVEMSILLQYFNQFITIPIGVVLAELKPKSMMLRV